MKRRESGAMLVECAILLPVFLLLIFGIVDWSRYMIGQSSLNSVTREAARYGSAVGDSGSGVPYYVDCDGIRDAGMIASHTIRMHPANITVEYDSGPGTAALGACPQGGSFDAGLVNSGDRILVTAISEFRFSTPLIGNIFGPTILSSTDRRTIFP